MDTRPNSQPHTSRRAAPVTTSVAPVTTSVATKPAPIATAHTQPIYIKPLPAQPTATHQPASYHPAKQASAAPSAATSPRRHDHTQRPTSVVYNTTNIIQRPAHQTHGHQSNYYPQQNYYPQRSSSASSLLGPIAAIAGVGLLAKLLNGNRGSHHSVSSNYQTRGTGAPLTTMDPKTYDRILRAAMDGRNTLYNPRTRQEVPISDVDKREFQKVTLQILRAEGRHANPSAFYNSAISNAIHEAPRNGIRGKEAYVGAEIGHRVGSQLRDFNGDFRTPYGTETKHSLQGIVAANRNLLSNRYAGIYDLEHGGGHNNSQRNVQIARNTGEMRSYPDYRTTGINRTIQIF